MHKKPYLCGQARKTIKRAFFLGKRVKWRETCNQKEIGEEKKPTCEVAAIPDLLSSRSHRGGTPSLALSLRSLSQTEDYGHRRRRRRAISALSRSRLRSGDRAGL